MCEKKEKKIYLCFHPVLQIHNLISDPTPVIVPHLKLLSELQVDVVHLGDGNVVVLSLLLVQQLVPERGE